MSQHDYNIANGGGAAVRADINNALLAVLSQNSGATAPTTTKPFMLWYDTTTGILKIRNAADSAWVTFAAGAIQDASIAQAKLAANVAGNGPAFSAVMTADQSVTANVTTKVAFSTEVFDSNSNYDTSTYRFTPTVAGYYQINLGLISNQNTLTQIQLLKNGTTIAAAYPQGTNTAGMSLSYLVYMNGSTDYLEAYGNQATTGTFRDLDAYSYFNGFLARAA